MAHSGEEVNYLVKLKASPTLDMTFERIASALPILVMGLYTQLITLEGLGCNSMGIEVVI